MSQFQREAEVLASLNHPHIASIHHLEEFERSRLLVLELVEGETLADRIARGPLPVDEAVEIAKQIAEASAAEPLLRSNVAVPQAFHSGSMADGRMIVTTLVGGRRRLVVAKPGEDPFPFAQTTEETSGPVTMIGKDEVAFVIGSGPSRKVAIASAADGRLIRRLAQIDGAIIQELASSPDSKTLYYAATGKIWATPSNGEGEPRLIRDGDSFAVDPAGKYVVVQLNEKDSVRLVRVFLDGTPEQPLIFPGVRLASIPIAANAVRADGVILKSLAVSSWDWAAGLLHPGTGKVERISLRSSLDVHYPTWSSDGRILLFGYLSEGTLWRFKPETPLLR